MLSKKKKHMYCTGAFKGRENVMYTSSEGELLVYDYSYLLAHALGSKRDLHALITQLYQRDEVVFYDYYKRSQVDIPSIFRDYPYRQVKAIYRCLGMILHAEDTENFSGVYKLIRTGFRLSWDYMKNRTQFDLQHFKSWLDKHTKETSNIVGEIAKIADIAVAAIYLAEIKEYPVEFSGYFKEPLEFYVEGYLERFREHKNFFSYKYVHEDDRKLVNKFIQTIPNIQGRVSQVSNHANIRSFMQTLMNEYTQEIMKKKTENVLNSKIELPNVDKAFQEASRYGWMKYFQLIELLLNDIGIRFNRFSSQTKLSKEDADWLYLSLCRARNEMGWNQREMELLAVFYMMLIPVLNDYNDTKKFALSGYHEQIAKQRQEMKGKFEEWERERLSSLKEKQQIQKQAELEINKWKEELKKANRQIEQLRQELQETVQNNKEVHSLRQYISTQQEELASNKPSLSTEEILKSLRKKKCAVIGGHINWQQKLQALLPEYRYLHADELNRDMRYIDALDAVFINTSVLSHALYGKLMNNMEGNHTDLYYLSGATNIERTLEEMYDALFQS